MTGKTTKGWLPRFSTYNNRIKGGRKKLGCAYSSLSIAKLLCATYTGVRCSDCANWSHTVSALFIWIAVYYLCAFQSKCFTYKEFRKARWRNQGVSQLELDLLFSSLLRCLYNVWIRRHAIASVMLRVIQCFVCLGQYWVYRWCSLSRLNHA